MTCQTHIGPCQTHTIWIESVSCALTKLGMRQWPWPTMCHPSVWWCRWLPSKKQTLFWCFKNIRIRLGFFIEPTCATCTVGSYASLSVRLSVCLWLDQNYWTIIHISKTIAPRVLKFGQVMGVGDPEVDFEARPPVVYPSFFILPFYKKKDKGAKKIEYRWACFEGQGHRSRSPG